MLNFGLWSCGGLFVVAVLFYAAMFFTGTFGLPGPAWAWVLAGLVWLAGVILWPWQPRRVLYGLWLTLPVLAMFGGLFV
jgi:hypothetical protein